MEALASMSLILFTQLSFPAAGFFMGACFGAAYGRSDVARMLVGAGLGGIAGGFAGVAAHFLLWGGLIALIHLAEWWRPSYPTCRQGRCGPRDYTFLWEDPRLTDAELELSRQVQQDHHGMLVRCRCGDTYVSSAKQRQLLEVSPEGTVRPYRYHKPFGREWLPARDA